MCVHESENSPAFKKLEAKMKKKGLVAVTLVGWGGANFSMFVNPKEKICIQRAVHDLRTWHPDAAGFSMQSEDRLGVYYDLDELRSIPGRRVPDSLDLEEGDAKAVYARCVANGYTSA